MTRCRKHDRREARSRQSTAWLAGFLCAVAFSAVAHPAEQPRIENSIFAPAFRRHTAPPSSPQRLSTIRSRTPEILQVSRRPYDSPAVHPTRKVRLVNGDEVTAEILAGDREFLHLRLFGDQRLRIPVSTLDSITALPGERELLNETFADGQQVSHGELLISSAQPARALPLPAAAGNCRAWFRFRLGDGDPHAAVGTGWTWTFAEDVRLRVRLDQQLRWRTIAENMSPAPVTRQPIAARNGWQLGRLQILDGRLFLSVNGQLLYAGPSPGHGPAALEFFAASADPSSPVSLHVDHLALVERHAHVPDAAPATVRREDEIVGAGGETWWGDLQSVGPHGVEWTDGQSAWQRPWPQLQGVWFRSATQPISGKPLRGDIVDLELQPSADRPDLPADHLTVALGPSESGRLFVDHPLWGRLAAPHAAVRKIEAKILGESRLLDARDIRWDGPADRQSRSVTGQFSLEKLPRGNVFLALEAQGLEPSGPDTPPGSPTLKSLRAGKLVTELHVNDHRIGTWNELTSQWSLPGRFDRLRLRLPSQCLQRGANTWRISQTPDGESLKKFDDCRLRNLSLEIETTLP